MEEIKGLTIDQLEVGQKASFTKTVTEQMYITMQGFLEILTQLI